MSRRFFRACLAAVFLTAAAISCSKAPVPSPSRCTGDIYGELHSPMVNDERAKEHRTRWSPVKGYRGNSFWFMRTSGYTPSTVTYICDFGYIYNQETLVTCDDAALLPAISIDLSRAQFTVAPPVGSNDILSISSAGL